MDEKLLSSSNNKNWKYGNNGHINIEEMIITNKRI
jgi:hypothetical protein